jgi:SOS response regulatory protein OraA/RecX
MLGAAGAALRRRDLSAAKLAQQLERVGGSPRERRHVVETLERVGVVDDVRLARNRAAVLSDRGYGNAAIDADLAGRGIEEAVRAEVIATLPGELERLERLLERRGTGPRAARLAAGRGFGEEAVAAAGGVDFANDP